MKSKSILNSLIALLIITLIISSNSLFCETPVSRHGQLHVDGQFLKDEHGEKVILRGQSYGWSSWWPQYWNADVVAWIAEDWKVDITRAAMGVHSSPGYLNDSTNQVNLVKTVVDAAIDNGIYVIIDWHSHNIYLDEAIGFFSLMAETYNEYPNVIYEIFNEPEDETWAELKEYSDTLIKAIRQHDPYNIIVVPTARWCQDVDIAADDPIEGHDNIMYAFHFYADGHRSALRNRLITAIEKELPIFTTEMSGMNYTGSGPINYPEWYAYFDVLEENYISWLNWQIADKPGESCSVLLPGASASGEWTDDELNESGKFIRWLLRTHAGLTTRVDTIFLEEDVDEVTLNAGDSIYFEVNVLPEDATNQAMIWDCRPTRVASVDEGWVKANEAGSATLTILSQDGLKRIRVSVKVIEDETNSTAGQNIVFDNGIRIYPNPVVSIINISFDNIYIGEKIAIYNILGEKLIEKHIASNDPSLDISDFNSGIYILRITNYNSEVITKKIVKQ